MHPLLEVVSKRGKQEILLLNLCPDMTRDLRSLTTGCSSFSISPSGLFFHFTTPESHRAVKAARGQAQAVS